MQKWRGMMRFHSNIRFVSVLLLLLALLTSSVGCKKPWVVELNIIDFTGYNNYLKGRGYTDCVFLPSNVSEYGDSEVAGFCKGNGEWYGVISVQVGDDRLSLYCETMSGRSMYLVEKDGTPCVLVYTKSTDGDKMINHQYEVFCFNEQGQKDLLVEKGVSCAASDQNNKMVTDFLAECKQYLDEKSQLVIDAHQLNGQTWPSENDVGFGTIPSGGVQANSNNNVIQHPNGGTPGYVKIKNDKSWLNLREGPGTKYPYVYLIPGDKNSIVKQAQGSPVTILETIHTGDKKNPEWVKIRIDYEGREIVGYSSKTFIREAGE